MDPSGVGAAAHTLHGADVQSVPKCFLHTLAPLPLSLRLSFPNFGKQRLRESLLPVQPVSGGQDEEAWSRLHWQQQTGLGPAPATQALVSEILH